MTLRLALVEQARKGALLEQDLPDPDECAAANYHVLIACSGPSRIYRLIHAEDREVPGQWGLRIPLAFCSSTTLPPEILQALAEALDDIAADVLARYRKARTAQGEGA